MVSSVCVARRALVCAVLVCPCTHTCIMCMHAYIHAYRIHTYFHACIHAYAYTYRMHTCIHAYIDTYAGRQADRQTDRRCMHACMHANIHACMHTYLHTCIHACMHTGLPGPRFGQLLLIVRTHNAWTDHDGRVRACARSGREEGEAFLGICAIDGVESNRPATGQKAPFA